jgi:hypothetical protein
VAFLLDKMEHSLYRVHEIGDGEGADIDSLTAKMMEEGEAPRAVEDRVSLAAAMELDLNTNYTVPKLTKIMEYYGLSKRKMTKGEMSQSIVFFEMEPENKELVHKRKMVWEMAGHLRDDERLAKMMNMDCLLKDF